MSYLLWFEPAERPGAAKEHILVSNGGKPDIRDGPPGLLMEAVLRCDWTYTEVTEDTPVRGRRWKEPRGRRKSVIFEASASVTEFLQKWQPWSEVGHWADYLSQRHSHLEAFPDYFGTRARADARRRGLTPTQWLRSTLEEAVATLLAGQDEPVPLTVPRPDALARFRGRSPAARYREHVGGLVRYSLPEARDPEAPIWTIIEFPYRHVVPWPERWFSQKGLRRTPPRSACFYAQDEWVVAFLEVGWALHNDVSARRCRHPGCHAWFLLAGRQGKRREFCQKHKRVGPVTRYAANLRAAYPKAVEVKKELRNLKARWTRGKIPEGAYLAQKHDLEEKLRWYRSIGLAPEHRVTRRGHSGLVAATRRPGTSRRGRHSAGSRGQS